MRVVIDGRMLGWTGIGRYTQRLLAQLEQIDARTEYIVLMQTADSQRWQPTKPNFRCEFVDIIPYSFGEQFRLPRVLNRLKPDLVHFTHFAVPLFYTKPFVVTIHDLILVEYKNIREGALGRPIYELKYLASRLVLRHAIKAARVILTPTNYTKDQLTSRFKIAPERVTATILGVDPLSLEPPAKEATPAPYLFSLGNSYPYKNLDLLVDAYAASQFAAGGGLLVLGGQQDAFNDLLRARVVRLGLEKQVRFPGRVSDEELARLYKNATLYVYPSLAEGFGLQGLEAMQYGLPVLSSNATCLPEVCGPAAEYFTPTDPAELTAKIDELVTDEKRRQAMVTAGYKQIKRFSWKAMAEKTLAAYRVAVKG